MTHNSVSPILPVHGGDRHAATLRWGQPQDGWLDLSTGLNPWPYPIPAFSAESWTRLPDSGQDLALRCAACHTYGAPAPDHILAGPGTSALIQAIPRCLPATTISIVSPTYGEHARAWQAAGHQVCFVDRLEQAADAPVTLVVNPNNPDGTRFQRGDLQQVLDQKSVSGGMLVVDEAFADCHPDLSIADINHPHLLVLRSFGKFYGLAGIRLGFVIGSPLRLSAIAAQLGPWPVSGIAISIGCQALPDANWANASRTKLAHIRAALDTVLADAGLTLCGGTDLFRFVKAPDARALYEYLGQNGILTRAFDHSPTALRLGLPPDDDAMVRLQRVLARRSYAHGQ